MGRNGYPKTAKRLISEPGISLASTSSHEAELNRVNNAPDAGVSDVAKELLKYLEAHPNNADTKEGICHWWILRQRLEECIRNVESALDALVEQGKISRADIGGRTVYRLASSENDGI